MKKQEQISEGYGVASFILGLTGLLLFWTIFFGIVLGIIGIIIGINQKKIQKSGLATAGIVLSSISLVISSIIFCLFILFFLFLWSLKAVAYP